MEAQPVLSSLFDGLLLLLSLGLPGGAEGQQEIPLRLGAVEMVLVTQAEEHGPRRLTDVRLSHPDPVVHDVLNALVRLSGQHGGKASAFAPPMGEAPAVDLGEPDVVLTLDEGPVSVLTVLNAVPVETSAPPPVVSPPARRVWLSGLVRAFMPDELEANVPPSVFDRLERGPPPEELQRREDRRQARQSRKKRASR